MHSLMWIKLILKLKKKTSDFAMSQKYTNFAAIFFEC